MSLWVLQVTVWTLQATLQVLQPGGPQPCPAPNPPVVEAMVRGAVVEAASFHVTVDGFSAVLEPWQDGMDNDGDGLTDEVGESTVSWPAANSTRFLARWPWALEEDDPATPQTEGVHVVCITVAAPETLRAQVSFVIHAGGGLDSVVVWPVPFDPSTQSLRVGFRVLSPGSVRVCVRDFSGARVLQLCEWVRLEAGWYPGWVCWDGRDSRGNKVGRGPYFVDVEFDNGQWIQRFVRPCFVGS